MGSQMIWRWAGLVAAALLALGSPQAGAQGVVHFLSLDDQHTMLDGYLFRVGAAGRHPAVIFMHGCGGLFGRKGGMLSRETDWAGRLTAAGYVVLAVDSFAPRHQDEMCSAAHIDVSIYAKRARDAYGTLAFLQAQPEVRADRVAIVGWSQGGGTVLHTVGTPSYGRPAAMTQPDFRAAVAFYPAQCSEKMESAVWTTTVPLLVLLGSDDVWIGAANCQRWLGSVIARGAAVTRQMYPGAAHDFDFPNELRRERPEWTINGVVPVTGTDPAARADAQQRVPAFLAAHLMN
jgi:dienelactone hydrolase